MTPLPSMAPTYWDSFLVAPSTSRRVWSAIPDLSPSARNGMRVTSRGWLRGSHSKKEWIWSPKVGRLQGFLPRFLAKMLHRQVVAGEWRVRMEYRFFTWGAALIVSVHLTGCASVNDKALRRVFCSGQSACRSEWTGADRFVGFVARPNRLCEPGGYRVNLPSGVQDRCAIPAARPAALCCTAVTVLWQICSSLR